MSHKVGNANVLVPDRNYLMVRLLSAKHRVSVTNLAVSGLQLLTRRLHSPARQTANSSCNPANPPQPQQTNTLPSTANTPVTVPVNL
jgi:hypothetical protein